MHDSADKTREIASGNGLLASMSGAQLSQLQPHVREVALEPLDVLYEPEQRIEAVYFPTSGVVSLIRQMRDGTRVECGLIGRDGIIGGLVVLGMEIAANQAIVQAPGRALRIRREVFLSVCAADESMRRMIARFIAMQLVEAQQITACNAAHDAGARLCRWLLQMHDKAGTRRLSMTQELLSNMLGVQRTTVTLIEKGLCDAGLIKSGRGWIELLDLEKLKALSCECYDAIRTIPANFHRAS
jgi:CRP-like cAMP-binding protein